MLKLPQVQGLRSQKILPKGPAPKKETEKPDEKKKVKVSPVTPPKATPPGSGVRPVTPCTEGREKEPSTTEECRWPVRQQFHRSDNAGGPFRERGCQGEGPNTLQEPFKKKGVWNKTTKEVRKKVWPGSSDLQRSHSSRSRYRSPQERWPSRGVKRKEQEQGQRKRKTERKAKRQRQTEQRKEAWGGPWKWQTWREGLRGQKAEQLTLLSFTQILVRWLEKAPIVFGATLRRLIHSPLGENEEVRVAAGSPYPLPLPLEAKEAMKDFVQQSMQGTLATVRAGLVGASNHLTQ